MSLEKKKGNLLSTPDQVIAHGCNCFLTFGAGVALAIKKAYPEAYAADLKTKAGDKAKLGSFSKWSGTKTIYNLYTQYAFGTQKRQLDYGALRSALAGMRENLIASKYTGGISIPLIGAGLAGGDWNKIEPIIAEELSSFKVTVWIL